jgi:hypothetical protein
VVGQTNGVTFLIGGGEHGATNHEVERADRVMQHEETRGDLTFRKLLAVATFNVHKSFVVDPEVKVQRAVFAEVDAVDTAADSITEERVGFSTVRMGDGGDGTSEGINQ